MNKTKATPDTTFQLTDLTEWPKVQEALELCGLPPSSPVSPTSTTDYTLDSIRRTLAEHLNPGPGAVRFPYEYCFMGGLGRGGKLRVRDYPERALYVDCYTEDLTARRRAAIKATNAVLARVDLAVLAKELRTNSNGEVPKITPKSQQ
jgi:hypothetical protein